MILLNAHTNNFHDAQDYFTLSTIIKPINQLKNPYTWIQVATSNT